ncbi:MAG: type II CAAX endopeptidase family protein [Clostridia bacterium]
MTRKSNVFIVSLIWLILASCFIFLRIVGNLGWLNWLGVYQDFAASFVVQILIMFSLSIILFSIFKKQGVKKTFADFSFKKIGFKAILISILIGVIVFILNIFVSNFFSFVLNLLGYEPLRSSTSTETAIPLVTFLLTVLTGCIFPAVCEEVSHRGLLVKGFESLGVKKIIILSGLFFGFMHFDITKFGYAFAIGCLLAYVTLLSRSIFPAMIIHFMNNFIVDYIAFSKSNGLPFGTGFENVLSSVGSADLFSSFLGIILLVCGLGILLFILLAALFKNTSLFELKKVSEDLAMKELRKSFLQETGIAVREEKLKEETIALEKEVLLDGKIKSVVINIPLKLLGIKLKQTEKISGTGLVLLLSCIFLGSIVTLMTFFFSFI